MKRAYAKGKLYTIIYMNSIGGGHVDRIKAKFLQLKSEGEAVIEEGSIKIRYHFEKKNLPNETLKLSLSFYSDKSLETVEKNKVQRWNDEIIHYINEAYSIKETLRPVKKEYRMDFMKYKNKWLPDTDARFLDLSIRGHNTLKRNGIHSLKKLIELSEQEQGDLRFLNDKVREEFNRLREVYTE
jgi:DNA-directed RNA polymerase alpha subunit